MFSKPKRAKTLRKDINKRTRVQKIGGLTFHKRVRKANSEERAENRKNKLYRMHNKAKLERQAKLRAIKLQHNPRALKKLKFKHEVEALARKKKIPIAEAMRLVRQKAREKLMKPKAPVRAKAKSRTKI